MYRSCDLLICSRVWLMPTMRHRRLAKGELDLKRRATRGSEALLL